MRKIESENGFNFHRYYKSINKIRYIRRSNLYLKKNIKLNIYYERYFLLKLSRDNDG